MATPHAIVFRILDELPHNTFLTFRDICWQVLEHHWGSIEQFPITRHVASALADIHRDVGLAMAFSGDAYVCRFALTRRVTTMPANALFVIGASIPSTAEQGIGRDVATEVAPTAFKLRGPMYPPIVG